jgi:DHA2 family multidrug resistance protein
MITISLMLATVMQALDTTIANIALPHMQGALSATQEQAAWILTSYIVASAIMTAPTGILASRFGRKRIFLIAIIGFTVSSALCGLALNLSEMVLFRVMQGIFGAALVPIAQAVLLDINPPERHGQAMALWGVGVMLGPILGPTLGGYLTEYISWRWVFYINVPVGIAAALGVAAFLHETPINKTRLFDFIGFGLLSVAIGGMQLVLDRGQLLDWFSSWEIIVEVAVAGLCFYLFVVHIFTTEHAFIEPHVFLDRNYAAALVLIFCFGVLILANMALLPPYLQTLMGYPVLTAGLVMAPRGLGTMVSMLVVGRLIGKVDGRMLILFGLSMVAISMYEMTGFTGDMPTWPIVWTGVIQGFGMGFVFIPLSTLAFTTLPPSYRNEGTSMMSLMRNIGSSIGISIVMTLLSRNTQVSHSDLVANMLPFGNARVILDRAAEAMAGSNVGVLSVLNAAVTKQAVTIAYLDDFKLMTVMVFFLMPLVLLLKGQKRKEVEKIEEETPEELYAAAE